MKSFETEIKKRMQGIALFAILGGLVIIIALITKLSGNNETDSILSTEMLIGFFVGMEFTTVYRYLKYRKAVSNHESLEAFHIKETDERNRIISLKTCKSCIYLAFGFLGFAGIITSFLNRTVFLTIGAILIVLVLLYGALTLYYSRKL